MHIFSVNFFYTKRHILHMGKLHLDCTWYMFPWVPPVIMDGQPEEPELPRNFHSQFYKMLYYIKAILNFDMVQLSRLSSYISMLSYVFFQNPISCDQKVCKSLPAKKFGVQSTIFGHCIKSSWGNLSPVPPPIFLKFDFTSSFAGRRTIRFFIFEYFWFFLKSLLMARNMVSWNRKVFLSNFDDIYLHKCK